MTHPCSSAAPGNDAGRRRVEDNKAVARRWFDLVTRGRVEELCAMTAPTWTMHGGPPALPTGPDGIRTLFRSFGRIDQTWTVSVHSATWSPCMRSALPIAEKVKVF